MPRWLGRFRLLFLVAAIAAVSLLAFAACEDDKKEEGETPAAGETPADGGEIVQPTLPIKIGYVISFTGDLGDFGVPHENSARLAVEEINAAGGVAGQLIEYEPMVVAGAPGQGGADDPALGVDGQPLELVTADDATDPNQGVTEATRLIEVEGVDFILGSLSSGVTLQIAESVTGPNNVLQISGASSSPSLTNANDNDFLFRTPIHDTAQGAVLAKLAKDRGIETVCNMYVNNAYGEGLSDAFTDNFEAAGGTVTAAVPHEEELPTYASELETCTADGPQALAGIAYPESAGQFLREAVEGEVVDEFLFVDGTKSPAMLDQLGWENFDGMVGTAPGTLSPLEAGDVFDAAYEAAYGEPAGELPFMRETYDAVYLMALAASKSLADGIDIREALREVANPEGEVVSVGSESYAAAIDFIANGQDINYEGASGPVDLDANGDVLIGAVETYHVDAAAKKFVTDTVYKVDLNTNEVTPLE
jgi:branched-chain amino acid transport system substrate-binding protein